VTDDIRGLTARLAEEPGSLAFLELAEALRRRGQLDAAYKVARGGLARYPGLADAHDLMARVLSDQGDLAGAFDAWSSALQLDPMRTTALKGIAFLYFRAGDTGAALEQLQGAMEVDPDDPTIRQAIARVGAGVPRPSESAGSPPPAAASEAAGAATPTASRPAGLFDELEGGERGLLLVDANGLRVGGRLPGGNGEDLSDRVAAQLAGLSREAARATRLLGLGGWQSIAIESPDGHLVLAQPTPDTVLLAARDASLPMGRVGLLVERASRAARAWLESQG
jgi:predicted regulator of Ras-like GTPase activity (Roadblock/LC7/MglB family)